jgi:hypothetical protein
MSAIGKVLVMAIILFVAANAGATVPRVINVQGRLMDNGSPPADGPQLIKFKIYGSESGDDSLWSSGYQTVQVGGGLFDYMLGSMIPFPADLFEPDSTRYLGITVGAGAEMSPRTPITSGAYALRADVAATADVAQLAQGVNVGVVDEAGLADSAVSSAKIRTNAVRTEHIRKAAVNSGDIQDSSITDSDISASANIHFNKIRGTALTVNYAQHIFSEKVFRENVSFINDLELEIHDSTMRITADGIRIGDGDDPVAGRLLSVERHVHRASPNAFHGIRSMAVNTSTGPTYGISGNAQRTHGAETVGNLYGVYGASYTPHDYGNTYGVYAQATGGIRSYGLFATASGADVGNFCAYIDGYTFIDENLYIDGSLSKQSGSFKIDHPQDPENKYLYHSFVESPDMMNVYNGNAQLDRHGEAVVELPEYFEALNKDFRYQLTAIGAPGPNLYVASEIAENRFTVAGGEPFGKVSWQVTGVRKDPWAEEHRIVVEVDKSPRERGLYLHPELYGEGEEKDVNFEDRMAGRAAAARIQD